MTTSAPLLSTYPAKNYTKQLVGPEPLLNSEGRVQLELKQPVPPQPESFANPSPQPPKPVALSHTFAGALNHMPAERILKRSFRVRDGDAKFAVLDCRFEGLRGQPTFGVRASALDMLRSTRPQTRTTIVLCCLSLVFSWCSQVRE